MSTIAVGKENSAPFNLYYEDDGKGSPVVLIHGCTFAADLNKLLTKLDLKKVSLVGFSMGSGEVTRYLGEYGSKRVRKAVLIGTRSVHIW